MRNMNIMEYFKLWNEGNKSIPEPKRKKKRNQNQLVA